MRGRKQPEVVAGSNSAFSIGKEITAVVSPELIEEETVKEPEIPEFYATLQGTKENWVITIKSTDEALMKFSYGDCPLDYYGQRVHKFPARGWDEKDVVKQIPRILEQFIESYRRCQVKYDVYLDGKISTETT